MCSDPIKAYLLDGECVKEWSHNALEREQSHLLQVCSLAWWFYFLLRLSPPAGTRKV